MRREEGADPNGELAPVDPASRRATDQIDPYALIERAERLLNTDPHDAIVFALRAQSVARARGAEGLIARAHYVAGSALMQIGDWSGAIRQLSHAEHIYRGQNDVPAQCRMITQLATACAELGEYSDALDGFSQAEKLGRQYMDHPAVRRALVHASGVHVMLGDFAAARESLREALELPSGTAADEGLVVLQFGMVDMSEGLQAALAGDAATVGRRMAEGEEHFEVALELFEGTTDRSNTIATRIQRGSARCWRGNFSAGLRDLGDAAEEAARTGFMLRDVQARLELGYHMVAAGRESEGLRMLTPALQQAEALGDLRRPSDLHERLSALYEARQEFQRALMHHKRYVEVQRRLDGRLSSQRARLHAAREELQRLRKQTAALHQRARDLEQSRSRLERLALEDELTGLANRRSFTKEFEHWCARARAGQVRFGLVVCDIDDFKRINDTYSHMAGDAVLRELGVIIRAGLRDSDLAARLGGDEFALLLADSEGGAAAKVAERILAAVRQTQWGRLGDGMTVTLSAGLAESIEFGDSSELVRRADESLYSAKHAGRDCLHIWRRDA